MNVQKIFDLSVAAHRQGKLTEAGSGYSQVLNSQPEHVKATQLLGVIALQSGQYERSEELLIRAIKLDANYGEAYHNLARLHEARGSLSDAVENYLHAASLMPDNSDTSFSLANVYTALGEFKDGETWYRRTLALDANHAPAHRQLSRLLDHHTVDNDMRAMEKQLEEGVGDGSVKMHLAFGLGKAYEDIGEYSTAIDYFEMANKHARARFRFDIDDWDKKVDSDIAVFSEKLFRDLKGYGYKDARPIFILGMPRSGTSLVEQILSSHSKVFGGGELQALNISIMKYIDTQAYSANVPSLEADVFTQIAQDYLQSTSKICSESNFVTDKKPDNFKLIGMIKLIFPNAIVINCCRSPLDNCFSLYKNHFSDNGPFYSYDQSEVGQYYRGYLRLMQHWHRVLPDFIYDIGYESLVSDLESEVRELLLFCGLDYETSCLDFFHTRRAVRTASAIQVRKPIYQSSVGLSERYVDRLKPMIAALSKEI